MLDILYYVALAVFGLCINGVISVKLLPYLKFITEIKWHLRYENDAQFFEDKYSLKNLPVCILFPLLYLCNEHPSLSINLAEQDSSEIKPHDVKDFNAFYNACSNGMHIVRFFSPFATIPIGLIVAFVNFTVCKLVNYASLNTSADKIREKQNTKYLPKAEFVPAVVADIAPPRVSIYEIIKEYKKKK